MEPNQSIRAVLRRAAEQALADERRDAGRRGISCSVAIRWHHSPLITNSYAGLDLSESGLRIRSSNILPEGMTGRVMFQDGLITFDRAAVISWCRGVRDESGRIDVWDAGLRLL
ncbi:MAG: hypothetical protein EXS17_04870 [Phycisphaerales bacterium]|nr:hypothetical protein [Phycisphaerales bacterium]